MIACIVVERLEGVKQRLVVDLGVDLDLAILGQIVEFILDLLPTKQLRHEGDFACLGDLLETVLHPVKVLQLSRYLDVSTLGRILNRLAYLLQVVEVQIEGNLVVFLFQLVDLLLGLLDTGRFDIKIDLARTSLLHLLVQRTNIVRCVIGRVTELEEVRHCATCSGARLPHLVLHVVKHAVHTMSALGCLVGRLVDLLRHVVILVTEIVGLPRCTKHVLRVYLHLLQEGG